MKPRSQRAHDTVLDSAIALFAENGIEGTSVDAIAAHSGVSKATIYKHWPDKRALCLEALGKVHGHHLCRPEFNTGDLRKDLIDFLNYRPPAEFSELREKMMPSVIAYAARDQEFGRSWREHIMGPALRQAQTFIERGISTGELKAGLEPSLCVVFLLGPLMFTKIFPHMAPPPENLASAIAGAFLRAFGRQPGLKE
ncbi:MAG: TetR/AcrR family transcriptional regulator [Acidobacteria bacterium]|nr:TetR/AcrR family transcriptional regulator [Acidobacteriota bacterium]